jgi:hypothetical protein
MERKGTNVGASKHVSQRYNLVGSTRMRRVSPHDPTGPKEIHFSHMASFGGTARLDVGGCIKYHHKKTTDSRETHVASKVYLSGTARLDLGESIRFHHTRQRLLRRSMSFKMSLSVAPLGWM